MFATDQIEVWNLADGGYACSGSVDIFNVVGRVADPSSIEEFFYQLNERSEIPVVFARSSAPSARLRRAGDFNIDTISVTDLADENRIAFRIRRPGGNEHRCEIFFRVTPFENGPPQFRLDLDGVREAEQIGQIVEGPWQIGEDEPSRRYLEITPQNAGYDRIILFGHRNWTSGYEVTARLAVTRIAGNHNIGLIFKWNPHERGDGTWLGTKWSSGLAYFCSYGKTAGIRIRFGVQSYYDETGTVRGDHVLAHKPLVTRPALLFNRLKRKLHLSRWPTQMRLNEDYVFRMLVHPGRYALTVWPAAKPEPPPQLVVDDPMDPLPQGAVGILAYNVGVRLYEFEVRPVTDNRASSAAPIAHQAPRRQAVGTVSNLSFLDEAWASGTVSSAQRLASTS